MATCFRVAVMSSSGVSGPVTCTGEPVEDVTISCDPHTTLIGDLAELVGFGRGPLLVDGRRFPPSATVAETTLTDGSVMGTPCHPGRSVATSGRGPVVWVETIAGESSGHSQSLPVGRFHLTLQGPDLEVTGARTAETRILLDIGESWVTIRAGNSPVVVDGSLLEQPIAIRPGDGPIVNLGDTRLRISPWLKPPGRTESDGAVHRVPRVPLVAPDPSFATDVTPSAAAEPQPLSWISFAAPIPAAMIMAIALGRMIFMLFAILSPMALIGRWYDGKRRHRKQQAQYELDLQLLRLDAFDQIMKARVDATSYARAKHPDPVQVVQRAIRTDPRLWERRPQHDDFAHVAVAVGEPAWHFEPPLPSPVEDLAEAINYLTSAPIPVDLKAGPLGIVGPRSRVLAAARAAIVELAALSGPVDLPIAVIAPDDRVPDWDWTKWLPHLGSPPRVATTSQAVGSVLDPLRTTGHTATNTATPEGPLAVLVIDGIDLLRRHDSPLRTALADDSRISAIVIADNEADLPASCTWILNIDLDGIGAVSDLATGRRTEHVTPVGMDTSTATEAARALSRLTDPDGPATTAQLRTQVALPSVTGPIDAASVLHRWAAEGIDPNPTATIGTGTAGPLEIDLVHDGPHALLAGTTGAGKSELLRSFVLSIATRYSAETVNFVLVDYKGGGAFDACADLPHTVAVVTDLDGHLGARALRSLQAELRFREMTFRESGAHDLKSYRSKTGPMPRLVVVVDEFATLASDLPDVLDALVDIAQRGRSLGIHMVLATQRPAGIVDAKIKSNTNLRISLRVQDDSDSQDVLGTNHAARLGRSELGRGFVRMGAGDVVPFQAAYSGGVTPDPASRSGATIEPFRLVPGVLDSAGETEGQPSDLVRMVHEIGLAHEKAQIGETRKPWLPVLNSSIGIDELPVGTGVVIGILDVPAEQRRQELAVPLGSEHVLVFGVDQRETAASLRTIALRAMTEFHPDDLHVYLIDSGSRSLGAFRAAPAVGGYVVHDDAGRLDRMLTLLESQLVDRKAWLGDGGDTSDLPLVAVVIEGLGGLIERLLDAGDHRTTARFASLVRESSGLGISLVATATSDRQIPTRVSSHFATRLLHQLADPTAYASFGLRQRDVPSLAGRAVIDPSSGLDGVIASITDSDIEDLLEMGLHPRSRPPDRLRDLPDRVSGEDLDRGPTVDTSCLTLPLGVRTQDVETMLMSIQDMAVVLGSPGSGRSSTLVQLAQQAAGVGLKGEIVAIAPMTSALSKVDGVAVLDPEGPTDDELLSTASLVIVDDAERVSPDVGATLKHFAQNAGTGRWIVAAMRPADTKALMEWTSVFRQATTGFVLQPRATDGDALKVMFSSTTVADMKPGQGVLVTNGKMTVVQAAVPAG